MLAPVAQIAMPVPTAEMLVYMQPTAENFPENDLHTLYTYVYIDNTVY